MEKKRRKKKIKLFKKKINGKQKKKDKSLHIKPAITCPTLKLAIKRIDKVKG